MDISALKKFSILMGMYIDNFFLINNLKIRPVSFHYSKTHVLKIKWLFNKKMIGFILIIVNLFSFHKKINPYEIHILDIFFTKGNRN